jgi:hypothetical protein
MTPRRTQGMRPVHHVVPIDLQWCPDGLPDPLSTSHTSLQHQGIAVMLRSRPGTWARIGSLSASYVSTIRQGRIAAYRPGGSYEAQAVNGQVYARYVGDPETD